MLVPVIGGFVNIPLSGGLIPNQAFVFEGDSHTYDDGSGNNWSTQLMHLSQFAGLGSYYNYAFPGNGLSDLVARYASSVKPHRPSVAGTNRSVLFAWVGANDENQDTATWLAAWESYINTAKADGFYVVAFTLTMRQDPPWDAFEANRLAMNVGIRASTAPSLLIDTDALFPNSRNTRWFNTDKAHLITIGDTKLAAVVNAVMSGYGRLSDTENVLGLDNTFTGQNTLLMTAAIGGVPLTITNKGGNYCFQVFDASNNLNLTILSNGAIETAAGIYSRDNRVKIDLSTTDHLVLNYRGTIVLDVTAARTTINNVLSLTPQAAPGSPSEGDIYAGTDHHLHYYNGTSWVQIG